MYMESLHIVEKEEHVQMEMEMEPGPPHEVLFLVLAYLPLLDLLAMTEVCSSLKDAVNKDVLLWLNIIVERPLNLRISDDTLMKITSKANGRLTTLALINSEKVTDAGLLRVVEKNPLIDKLYIPSCTGLTPEGIIRSVKTLTQDSHNLESLKMDGICNLNKEHLETLGSCVETIDVDICSKCSEVRLVYNCPRETCKRKKEHPLTECKGCKLCIPRCEECGGCVGLGEVGEAACEDVLCSDCWLLLPKCNFCNKPYCKRHGDQRCSIPCESGWVCGVCYDKFFRNSCD